MRVREKDSKRGFTFVEILVAVAVVMVLASVVYAAVSGMRTKARDTQRKSDIEQIRLALRLYVDANGSYPSVPGGEQISSGSTIGTLLAPYMAQIPVDPLGGGLGNAYVYDSDIKCAVEGASGPSHIMVYARQTEGGSTGNWGTICGTRNCGAPSCGTSEQKATLPAPSPSQNSYGFIIR